MTRDRRHVGASGPDAYGKRRVLPATTGAALLPSGTCPVCAAASHPGRTCGGRSAAEVVRELRRWPGTIESRTDGGS